eukprot:2036539-Alexandrium_andersonii.AAC.1
MCIRDRPQAKASAWVFRKPLGVLFEGFVEAPQQLRHLRGRLHRVKRQARKHFEAVQRNEHGKQL